MREVIIMDTGLEGKNLRWLWGLWLGLRSIVTWEQRAGKRDITSLIECKMRKKNQDSTFKFMSLVKG